MTLKVFVSSNMRDQRIIEGLKEALKRYGIEPSSLREVLESMFAERRALWREFPRVDRFSFNLKRQIQSSDCVLVVVGRDGRPSEFVDSEMALATAQNKLVIPIVEEGARIPKTLAGREYIPIERNQPRLSFERAAQYLNKLRIEKERRNAIGGLLLFGLGFLLLAALVSD